MTHAQEKSSSNQFYFDQERLQSIADKNTIRDGLKDHRENKVMDIDHDRDILWGQVEGEDAVLAKMQFLLQNRLPRRSVISSDLPKSKSISRVIAEFRE